VRGWTDSLSPWFEYDLTPAQVTTTVLFSIPAGLLTLTVALLLV
jgi:hypothetical protein